MKRCFAEVSAHALRHNAEIVRGLTGQSVKLCAVVKADAYGHGAVPVAHALRDADFFGVATPWEALELRAAGVRAPILVMGLCPPEFVREMSERGIAIALYDRLHARACSHALGGQRLGVHVKLDTGMSRLGFADTDEGLSDIRECLSLPGLRPEAAFTHLATADGFVVKQLERFRRALDALGQNFSLRHCANSGAVLQYVESHFDMVRPGLLLYGYAPDRSAAPGLIPAMRFCSTVVQVKTLYKGDTVSYDRTFTVRDTSRVAVVAAGYADGVPRALSNRGFVLIRGQLAPIVGRVCMDMLMADVSAIPGVQSGDIATLFGRDEHGAELNAWEQAERIGAIPYELFCGLTRRVERVYVD